jgi:hypothetical protein
LLGVSRGRWDGECWRDGGIGGVRGCGWAGIVSVGAGTGASTGGGGSASSALLAHIRGTIVSDVVFIGFTFVLLDTAGGWVATNRGRRVIIWTRSGPTHAERALGTTNGLADRHGGGKGPVGCVEACLDKILALWLGDALGDREGSRRMGEGFGTPWAIARGLGGGGRGLGPPGQL